MMQDENADGAGEATYLPAPGNGALQPVFAVDLLHQPTQRDAALGRDDAQPHRATTLEQDRLTPADTSPAAGVSIYVSYERYAYMEMAVGAHHALRNG